MIKVNLSEVETNFICSVWRNCSLNADNALEILQKAYACIEKYGLPELQDCDFRVDNGFLFLNDKPAGRVDVLPQKAEFSERAYYSEGRILVRQENDFD